MVGHGTQQRHFLQRSLAEGKAACALLEKCLLLHAIRVHLNFRHLTSHDTPDIINGLVYQEQELPLTRLPRGPGVMTLFSSPSSRPYSTLEELECAFPPLVPAERLMQRIVALVAQGTRPPPWLLLRCFIYSSAFNMIQQTTTLNLNREKPRTEKGNCRASPLFIACPCPFGSRWIHLRLCCMQSSTRHFAQGRNRGDQKLHGCHLTDCNSLT